MIIAIPCLTSERAAAASGDMSKGPTHLQVKYQKSLRSDHF